MKGRIPGLGTYITFYEAGLEAISLDVRSVATCADSGVLVGSDSWGVESEAILTPFELGEDAELLEGWKYPH